MSFCYFSQTLFYRPFTQARWAYYTLLSSVLLSQNMSCEYQVFQALLPHYGPQKFQPPLPDVKYKLPLHFHSLQSLVIAYMFSLLYPQPLSLEPRLFFLQVCFSSLRRLSSVHRPTWEQISHNSLILFFFASNEIFLSLNILLSFCNASLAQTFKFLYLLDFTIPDL